MSQTPLLDRVVRSTPVGGGCITDARRAELDDGTVVFLKRDHHAPPWFFAAEAAGLDWLRAADAIGVPAVLEVGARHLVIEWIEPGRATSTTAPELGRRLAAMHAAGASTFGAFRSDVASYLATLALPDTRTDSWLEFWTEGRMRPLVAMAIERGLVPPRAHHAIDRLRALGADVAGDAEPPARCHGDLWSGNVHVAVDGTPWVVDPSAHGGHRETDLAMLDLFGGIDVVAVRAAYAEVAPLGDGWGDRVALHQIVPLLAHIVLFGSSYVDATRRALRRYVGDPW